MQKILLSFIATFLCCLAPIITMAETSDLASLYQDVEQTVLDISERSYDGGNALSVTLAVPLDPGKDHSGYLNISEEEGGKVDGAWIISESGKTLYFPYALPSHEYNITVYMGLTGINDSRLKSTESKTVWTNKMNPMVTFGSRGIILPSTGSKGLPVVTVNVNEVDIDFHYVPEKDIPSFLLSWRTSQSKRVWELNKLTTHSDLVYSGRFQLNPPANKRRTVNIPVHMIKLLEKPGMYMAVMKTAGSYPGRYQTTYYMVSDLGLHIRSYKQQLDVYVNSIKSAEPLSNVQLLMLNKKGRILQETNTTPDGVGTFAAAYDKNNIILAKQGTHVSLLKFSSPALDLSEFSLGDRAQKKIETFFYGPRDIYRPGESVDINMLVRNGDAEMLASFPIPVKIKRPDGQVIKEFLWQTDSSLGYYHYKFKLPGSAQTGKWIFSVTPSGRDEHLYTFKVEDFLPERMSLDYADVNKEQRFVSKEQAIKVPLSGMYFYGSPASGNRMSGKVSYKQNRNPLPKFKDFEFGNINDQPKWSRFDLEDIILGNKGHGEFTINPKWKKINSPLTVRLSGSLFDSGGRPVSRSISYTVWPHEDLIGVRPLFSENELENNSLARFELIMTDQHSIRKEGNEVELKLIREARDYYWAFSADNGWRSRYNEKEYTEFSKIITIKKEGRNEVEFPVENGHYRLEVTDPKTGVSTSTKFHAGYSWWWYNKESGNTATRPDAVSLILDKKKYNPGDIAKLTIISPHSGKGFVVIESDEPLWFSKIQVPKEGITIDIPIDKDWKSHDLYISAMVLRPQDSKSKRTINRAMGLTHLALDRSDRALTVKIEALEKIRPNTTQAFVFNITDTKNKALPEVMLTVAAVDVGVLNITDFQTPTPYNWFFDQRRYSIDSYDIYGKIIESFDGALANIRFGGDEDLDRGGKAPMTSTQVVAFFTGPVQVEPNGNAMVNLDIPDFNGKLRIMALAFAENKFGSSDTETIVAAPIIAELSLPRFLTPGDEAHAVVDIRNITEEKQILKWSLSADSPLVIGAGQYEDKLQAGEKSIQTAIVKVDGYKPQSTITLKLNNNETVSENIAIKREWKLGIRPAYPAVTKRVNAVLQQGETLSLDPALLKKLIPDTVKVNMLVSAKPRLEMVHHLQKLLHYPYGCLEQTTSTAFPFLLVDDTILSQLKITGWSSEKRKEAIEKGLQRIAAKQRPNGSFGLWSNKSHEEHYLTVYASHFMLEAKAKGYFVSREVLDKAMRRLRYYLRNNNLINNRYTRDKAHYNFAFRSYAGYVLSKSKRANLSNLRNLLNNHQKDSKSGLPLIHLGLALKTMGDHKNGEKAIQIGLERSRSDLYLGDYGSDFRDTALIISLLHKHQVENNRAEELLFELAEQLRAKNYLSTQERIALLRAAIPQLGYEQSFWQGSLSTNEEQVHINGEKDYSKVFSFEKINSKLTFTSEAKTPLYATILLSGYPAEPIEPVANKVSIERTYYNDKGEVTTLSNVTTGDLIIVGLEISAKERLADLLVIDLVPAGLELENPNLIHSINMNDMLIDDQPVPELIEQSKIQHQEYRDDRFIAAIDQSAYRSSYLFYLARAVTPGSYNVPPPLVEDMYRPEIHGVGKSIKRIVIKKK
jgi:alpha-2-macroglobulin